MLNRILDPVNHYRMTAADLASALFSCLTVTSSNAATTNASAVWISLPAMSHPQLDGRHPCATRNLVGLASPAGRQQMGFPQLMQLQTGMVVRPDRA
jgi:hypothetical protein